MFALAEAVPIEPKAHSQSVCGSETSCDLCISSVHDSDHVALLRETSTRICLLVKSIGVRICCTGVRRDRSRQDFLETYSRNILTRIFFKKFLYKK